MRGAALLMLVFGLGWNATGLADSLPDPTQPPGFGAPAGPGAPSAPAAPVLQSTLVAPNRRAAIISGKRVKIGDTFQGAIVTDITAYEVRLNKGGRETRLRLLPKLTKETGTAE